MGIFIFAIAGLVALIVLRYVSFASLAPGFMFAAMSDGGGGGFDPEVARLIVQVVITVAVLASALYIILSGNYGTDIEGWACGIAGSVVGFWLPEGKKPES